MAISQSLRAKSKHTLSILGVYCLTLTDAFPSDLLSMYVLITW